MTGLSKSAALAVLQALVFSLAIRAEERAPIPESPEPLIPESLALSLPDPDGLAHTLHGGALAFVAPDPSVPLVEVVVVVPAGEALDPPGRRGVAGLTAAMLRRGGAGALDPGVFDLRADRLAAEIESFSGIHRSGAVLDVAAWRLEEGLDLLFGMLAEPRFDRERFRLLRRSLAEGVESQRSDPAVLGSRAWERWTALPGEPFGQPLDAEGVRELEVEDLRAFHARHWRPDRLVFAVSGAVDPRALVESLNRRLRDWVEAVGEPGGEPQEAAEEEDDGEERPESGLGILDVPTTGAVVLAGHRLEPAADMSSGERYAAVLLEEVIAGPGGVNRLVGRLRTDRGLVYAVDSELDLAPERAGRWLSLFHCEVERVGPALAAWRQEVERLRTETVDTASLAAARTAVLARLRTRFDTASGVAGTYAEDALVGRSHDVWLGLAEGLESVTPSRLRAVARELLRPEDVVVVVVGPRSRVVASLRSADLPDSWKSGARPLSPE